MEIEWGFEEIQLGVVASWAVSRGGPGSRDSPTTMSISQSSSLSVLTPGRSDWRIGRDTVWISAQGRWGRGGWKCLSLTLYPFLAGDGVLPGLSF